MLLNCLESVSHLGFLRTLHKLQNQLGNDKFMFIIKLLSKSYSHQKMLKARYNKITIVEETAEQLVSEEFAMTLALGKPPETKSSGLIPSPPFQYM